MYIHLAISIQKLLSTFRRVSTIYFSTLGNLKLSMNTLSPSIRKAAGSLGFLGGVKGFLRQISIELVLQCSILSFSVTTKLIKLSLAKCSFCSSCNYAFLTLIEQIILSYSILHKTWITNVLDKNFDDFFSEPEEYYRNIIKCSYPNAFMQK